MGMFDTIQLSETRKHACCRKRIKSLQTKDLVNLMRVYIEGATSTVEHKLRLPTKKEKKEEQRRYPSLAKYGFPFLVQDKKKKIITPHPQNTPFVAYDFCDRCKSMSYLDGVFDANGKLFVSHEATKERPDNE